MDTSRIYVSAQRDYLVWGTVDFDIGGDDPRVRGRISDFSDDSRKRLGRAVRNAVADYHVFVTLTYPPGFGNDGARCKRDLDTFLKRLRRLQVCSVDDQGIPRDVENRSWSVIWWQEWQKNGRIHFHLACTHFLDPHWLSQIWFEIVGSGNENHLAAGTNVKGLSGGRDGVAKYAAKYMSKREQKVAPDGWEQVGRFWGISGDRRTVEAATTLSPRQSADPRTSGLLDELIIEVEEAISIGELEELPLKDDQTRYRHWKIIGQDRGSRIRLLIRRINLQREVVDMSYSEPRDGDAFIFAGLHTRMFNVENPSELMQ